MEFCCVKTAVLLEHYWNLVHSCMRTFNVDHSGNDFGSVNDHTPLPHKPLPETVSNSNGVTFIIFNSQRKSTKTSFNIASYKC